MYEYEKPSPQELAEQRKKKTKQTTILIALALLGGIGYFFLGYLPEERSRAKEEIEEALKENYLVTPEKLNKSLWTEAENWQEYLDNLYLPSQVRNFQERMVKAIESKMTELEEEERDRPRKMREVIIRDTENLLEEEEKQTPEIQDFLEKLKKKSMLLRLMTYLL